MNIILTVDPIHPPLTGIGRYTCELAAGLESSPRIKTVRFFRHGQWVDRFDDALKPGLSSSSFRTILSRSPIAVRAYGKIIPALSRRRLRGCGDSLFHSPNFILQPFPGPSIATFHDLSVYRFPEYHPEARVNYMKREIPKALEMADHFIAVSSFTAEEMRNCLDIPPEKISVVYNGVSPAYHPRPNRELVRVLTKYHVQPGEYLLSVATLEPRKNIATLIKVYEKLPDSIKKNYPLLLCGSRGWNNHGLLELIKQHAGSEWLRFPGYIPEQDLPHLFAGAAGFLYPTLYEGFGLPALEAMASGVPVMTAEQSAVSEITRDCALLINPRDPVAMGETIIRLIDDQKWREQAVRKGLAISSEMSWSNCVRKTIQVYSDVIEQR
jgi:alpha-1,3-rhamnosyl/mannosyltransferase